jgi:hypothetical protein
MTKYQEKIINVQTGETTYRDFTAEEIAQVEAEALQLANQVAIQKAEAEAKATAKESALAKLAVLGLTADEIASL